MKKKRYENVMVIDDEELDLFLTEKILNAHEIAKTMIFYNNAKLALDFLSNLKENDKFPDLILLDLKMPGFSGKDFLNSYACAINENIKKKTKLVILTAYKFFDEANNITKKNYPFMRKIIEKPLKIEDLEIL